MRLGERNLTRNAVQLLLVLVVCMVASLAVFGADAQKSDDITYGSEQNPTGNPLGGGSGYNRIITSGNYLVSTADELITALTKTKSGDVIYVAPNARINLTGKVGLPISAGVTLAGNRGEAGSPGPLIYCDEYNTYGLFKVIGPNARITGLRIQGPDPDILDGAYVRPNSKSITVAANDVEIDNNEIYNWSYGGVSIEESAQKTFVHHNSIHHVRRNGLGYPVVVNKGTALIEANIFDYYRHAIASTGYIGTGYEARYNLVLANNTSHAFDMHGGADYCPKRTGTPCTVEEQRMAGEYVNIHHNTFRLVSQPAIAIRGVPRESTQVHHNWFYTTSMSSGFVFKNYNGGNTYVHDNVYGPSKRLVEVQITPDLFVRRGSVPGSGAIVAVASGSDNVKFGFISPVPNGYSAARGVLPIQVDVDMGEAFAVSNVAISLDGRVIYSAPVAPKTDELVYDTLTLADGQHKLTLTVSDAKRQTVTESITFNVRNWWQFIDEFLPPMEGGWFGTASRALTALESDGWKYATDNPSLFANDDNRRVAEAAGAWLVWDTPSLREFSIEVYNQTTNIQGSLEFAVSTDNNSWTMVPVKQVGALSATSDGWAKVELAGTIPSDMAVKYLRLTVNAATSSPVQLGLLKCKGLGERL